MNFNNIKRNLVTIPGLKQTKNLLLRIFPKLFLPPKDFYIWYNFIDSSQWWHEEQLKEYQWNKVKELLTYCNKNIPYYQTVFKRMGTTPDDFKTEDDFKKIPLLTRELLRDHAKELLPIGVDRSKIIKYNTGGSTGIPLLIYKARIDDIIEDAFMINQWSRVDYMPKDSRVILRGEKIENNRIWEYQPYSNAWLFSSYHLSNVYIKEMVDKLNKIKPKFLHVYPSSLWVFANLMKRNNLKLSFIPKAILCGSEKLFDHQRKLFAEVFGCRSYSWLGLAEQTILAGECEYNTDLHIFPQHSFVELIDENYKVITEPGIIGNIVGTNLHRYSFPLIRYLSGDMAKYSVGPCKCGRQFMRLEQVEGRLQHMIISRDGRIIPLTALVFGQHLLAFNKTELIQLHQRKPGEVEIMLKKGSDFTAEDAQILIDQLSSATNRTVKFFISYHDVLERTPTGKHKFLIQDLPVDFFNFNQDK
jgi:phenylacetate-CoA ligase